MYARPEIHFQFQRKSKKVLPFSVEISSASSSCLGTPRKSEASRAPGLSPLRDQVLGIGGQGVQLLLRAAAIYQDRHADAAGRIPATFEVIYLTGWAPHAAQPKPLAPGSARARLAEALDSRELPGGEKADPKK
mgnify:CR=1 FL=1